MPTYLSLETGSHLAQVSLDIKQRLAGLKLSIIRLPIIQYYDYRFLPPVLATLFFYMKILLSFT